MTMPLVAFFTLIALCVLGAAACFRLSRVEAILRLVVAIVLGSSALAVWMALLAFRGGRVEAAGGWLLLDPLSGYHLVVMSLVFAFSSLFALRYFGTESREGHFGLREARRFGSLWLGALAAMVVVLCSGNLGIMWVGIEATTLLTAFLICIHLTPASLEAMWKYLLICSVGVAFAFLGTLLVSSSSHALHLAAGDALVWSKLLAGARHLEPEALKVGFVFLLIGYGTKVGLAPLHSWLPDAHSQAPAPVSALFSGFMLNTALYCIMRFVPLVEGATGHAGWSRHLLSLFGLISILVAAAFIIFQHDLKRLLAYHSVEHLGIIALGLGLGGVGTFAALFHVLNHSLCKSLGFFCAGRLGQLYGTHDMRAIRGAFRASPVWGGGLFASILALIGVAPFALFMSELQIMQAAVQNADYWALGLFLAGAGVVFVGALQHAVSTCLGTAPEGWQPERRWLDRVVVALPLLALLVLGLWMPPAFRDVLEQAARVVGGPS